MPCNRPMITAEQIRAARAMLGWTRQQLSDAAGVPHSTLADFEKGRTKSMLTWNAGRIIAAFANAGVEFTDAGKHHGAGVRWKKAASE
jgi:transcriptional regulator with XRE-family HTH domain